MAPKSHNRVCSLAALLATNPEHLEARAAEQAQMRADLEAARAHHEKCVAEMATAYEQSTDQLLDRAEQAEALVKELGTVIACIQSEDTEHGVWVRMCDEVTELRQEVAQAKAREGALRAALDWIQGACGDRFTCLCGRPTGVQAIKMHAATALAPPPTEARKP